MDLEKEPEVGFPMHVEELSTDCANEEAAHNAAAGEHAQTIWQALKSEPKAVLWSVAVSTAMYASNFHLPGL